MASGCIHTPFFDIYNSFFSKITDDMYLELTEEETRAMCRELLLSAIPCFEFPRCSMDYYLFRCMQLNCVEQFQEPIEIWAFRDKMTNEEIDIIATYMVVKWLGQQLASCELTRLKYSGSDFKFTSQANHMQKLLQLKKDYEREGFHLQRLYKRRFKDVNGVYHSTFSKVMQPVHPLPKERVEWPESGGCVVCHECSETCKAYIDEALSWNAIKLPETGA